MELSKKQMEFIIKKVRDWDKQFIDYVEMKTDIERCLDF